MLIVDCLFEVICCFLPFRLQSSTTRYSEPRAVGQHRRHSRSHTIKNMSTDVTTEAPVSWQQRLCVLAEAPRERSTWGPSEPKARRERCTAYLEASVHKPLLPELPKHPPHALHERVVEGFVVVLKVDPPAQPRHGALPLLGIPASSVCPILSNLAAESSHAQCLGSIRIFTRWDPNAIYVLPSLL